MRKLLKTAVLAGSLGWAAAVLLQADLPGAWRSLCEHTSPAERVLLLALFFLPSAVSQWLDTHGWVTAYGPYRPSVGFGKLFSIRLAGEALNTATPVLPLGGEPVKALLMRAEGECGGAPAASVLSARLAMVLAQVLYVLAGVALVLVTLPGQSKRLSLLAVFPALLGLLILAGLIGAAAVPPHIRRQLAERLGGGGMRKAGRLFASVVDACKSHPREFSGALLWFFAGWTVMAGEFWAAAWVVGRPLPLAHALALEGLMNAICMATFFIPGNLGSQEAGLLFVSGLYQNGTPVGAVMLVLRRLREVLWMGVGFGCLAALGARVDLRALRAVREEAV